MHVVALMGAHRTELFVANEEEARPDFHGIEVPDVLIKHGLGCPGFDLCAGACAQNRLSKLKIDDFLVASQSRHPFPAWCDLLERYGHWKTVHRRFSRWCHAGVWERVFAALTADRDNQYLMLDSTIVRAHQQAATGKGGPRIRRWGVPEVD